MLHEPIALADCDDPDIVQAIADFTETAAEIRTRSVTVLGLKRGTPQHRAERQQIHELMTRVTARAGRIGLSTDGLMVLLNAELDRKARRGRSEPARPTSRTLLARVTNDQAAVANAELNVRAAEALLATARAALNASEGAYRAWACKPEPQVECA